MPAQKRYQTGYKGVYYIEGREIGTDKPERIYYIMYRKNGKQVHEKAGRQRKDDMTPAKASKIRVLRMGESGLSNKERREEEAAAKAAEEGRWTIDKLWKAYKANRKSGKSLKTDEGRYKKYLESEFGSKEPSELIRLDIDRLRIKLSKKLSPQTVKHVLNLLTWIINFGANNNLCQGISFHIQKPSVYNQKTEDLTPEQLKALLTKIDESENLQAANLMKLALYTGMRRGELFRLQWSDIDFERGFITIKEPKGGVDQRIPLNDAAKAVLESHQRTRSKFVFPGRGGRQRTDIKKQVNKIKDAAGLPEDFRALHGLRHVYASTLASSGKVDMYTLQKLLTHKSPQMTQRYAHLRDEALKSASDLAGTLISDALKESNKVISIKNGNKG